MANPVSHNARSCLQRSLRDLHKHIFSEFSQTSPGKRNLQSGLLAQQLLRHAGRCAVNEADLWNALFDLCLVQGRSWRGLELPEGVHFNLSCPLLWFLERLDPKDGDSFQVTLSPRDWGDYLGELSRIQKRLHIKRFCDWVEAEIALFAYHLFKTNKNCFQKDEFASFLNILIERLNLAEQSFTAGERDRLFSQAVSELKLDYSQSAPLWEVAKLHKPLPSDWQHKQLDCWLFQVWPFVKHFDWTMKELLAVIQEKKKLRPTGLFSTLNLDLYPCDNPEKLGQHVRTVLGLKHEDRPKGQPKPRLDGHVYLPPRWLLAVQL